MSETASRYAMLTKLSAQTSSEGRRDLLRQVTSALGRSAEPASEVEFAQLDSVLSTVAQEYSVEVRTEFAPPGRRQRNAVLPVVRKIRL